MSKVIMSDKEGGTQFKGESDTGNLHAFCLGVGNAL